jgi:hypothetical protein
MGKGYWPVNKAGNSPPRKYIRTIYIVYNGEYFTNKEF